MAKSKKTLDSLFKGTVLMELIDAEERCPDEPVEGDDEVIGEMNEIERKLYGLTARYGKLGGGITLKLEFDNLTEDERFKLREAASEVKYKTKMLRKVMWAVIRERLRDELLGEYSVGIRNEFRIVRFETSQNEPPDFLRKLLDRMR